MTNQIISFLFTCLASMVLPFTPLISSSLIAATSVDALPEHAQLNAGITVVSPADDSGSLQLEADHWQEIEGRPFESTTVEKYSPAVRITAYHERMDRGPAVDYASGMMVNRHIWPNRSVRGFERIHRDSPGQDETPTGTSLPLAFGPRGLDGIGGEMFPGRKKKRKPDEGEEKEDLRTQHQRQWDFLSLDVEKAFAQYVANDPTTGVRVEWNLEGDVDPAKFRCTLDGRVLTGGQAGGVGLVHEIPAEHSTPGEHELVDQELKALGYEERAK